MNLPALCSLLAFAMVAAAAPCAAGDPGGGRHCESAVYLRPSGERFVRETEIEIRCGDAGQQVRSTTQRGKLTLALSARYDAERRLLSARVTVSDGENKRSATAVPEDGAVVVRRPGEQPRSLDCPPGVIVTSAPDWTDAFQAVRRYDPQGEAAQRFAGLWIHPRREPQRLTFTVTRLGSVKIRRGDRQVSLWRLRVELRGSSRYVAWRSPQGQLVRLAPEDKPEAAIVLAGWEEATAALVP